jgi:hypothetical protein
MPPANSISNRLLLALTLEDLDGVRAPLELVPLPHYGLSPRRHDHHVELGSGGGVSSRYYRCRRPRKSGAQGHHRVSSRLDSRFRALSRERRRKSF